MSQTSDARSSMASYGALNASEAAAAAEYLRFYEHPPQVSSEHVKMWLGRGQNFIVAVAQVEPGGVIARSEQPDEYVILQPDSSTSVEVTWKGVAQTIDGNSIAFVPRGASQVKAVRGGRIILLFTSLSDDLCSLCVNDAAYQSPHPNIPPFSPWPEAPGGEKVRQYSLDVPDEPDRFGRVWRCSTFMVNVLPPQMGPREVTQLSPHHHDDFEQGSLVIEGAFVHHVRWPWNANLHDWRADEAAHCASPSLAVIPPPAIHTSRGVNLGINQMIDIFSPPRVDFSRKAGWVLNAAEYPVPEAIASLN